MSKPEWGIKRVCPSCSIKYYDFNKSPIICPKCEFEFDPDLLLKSRKGISIATKIPGMVSCTSAIRIIIVSVKPPKYPEITPYVTPNNIPKKTAAMPTRIEMRPP